MVRLLLPPEVEEANQRSRFQSHNGAIAAWLWECEGEIEGDCFNPTMVRLLRHLGVELKTLTKLFQSHNGAIAATKQRKRLQTVILVSIPQWCDCCAVGFNDSLYAFTLFQSHNGAIAAVVLHQAPCG